jgi:hypothetical protein
MDYLQEEDRHAGKEEHDGVGHEEGPATVLSRIVMQKLF